MLPEESLQLQPPPPWRWRYVLYVLLFLFALVPWVVVDKSYSLLSNVLTSLMAIAVVFDTEKSERRIAAGKMQFRSDPRWNPWLRYTFYAIFVLAPIAVWLYFPSRSYTSLASNLFMATFIMIIGEAGVRRGRLDG